MKKIYVVAFVLVGVITFAAPAAAQKLVPAPASFIEPVFTLRSPSAGVRLMGGSRVTVEWDLIVDQAIVNNNWSEMELFLVTDAGVFLRITPQLSVTTKTFEWTVPNIGARAARLVLQVGIEGEGDFYNLPQIGTFSIKPSSLQIADVIVNSMARTPKAGEDMEITWTANNIDRSKGFDVMISYDRGAHFFKAGTTTESRFTLPIDEDFSGAVTVKIIGRSADGTKVASLLTPDVTFRVKSKDQQ